MTPSTISLLPTVDTCERHLKAATFLDACLEPDADWRTFHVIEPHRWYVDSRQGSCLLTCREGNTTFIAAYNEYSPVATWPNGELARLVLLEAAHAGPFLNAAEHMLGGITFVCWNTRGTWEVPSILAEASISTTPIKFLNIIGSGAAPFLEWAADFHEVALPAEATRSCFVNNTISRNDIRVFARVSVDEWDALATQCGVCLTD